MCPSLCPSLCHKAGGYTRAARSGLVDYVLVLVGAIFQAGNPDT